MGQLVSILEQSFILSIMVFGVYITYKILDLPDLSVDGIFPLGAAVTATIVTAGYSPFIGLIASIICGCMGGLMTGLLHIKLKITALLSGILVMIGLYSINLRIMGKANIPLFSVKKIFDLNINRLLLIAIILVVIKIVFDYFFQTELGYILKATGDNEVFVESLGVNKGSIKILGLVISGGLVGLSGSLFAQYQGFADVGMGTGMVVVGLASVIIGDMIFNNLTFVAVSTISIFGTIIYKLSVVLALNLGLPPSDMKLITAVIVVIAISIKQSNFKLNFKVKGERKDVKNRKYKENFS
ncbi:MAG: ABC transporter permease [Firmicutes bacterium]|jgi:putative ABC transport system permease protein|nr:ABC transporter permease [Bacillota bacterium]